MPIQNKALLEIWLDHLKAAGIAKILINLHAHHQHVEEFLDRPKYRGFAQGVYEKDLLGTAGTLQANLKFFEDKTTLLAHADNLCLCDLSQFVEFHKNCRPKGTELTMMTFRTDRPQTCGIVELDAAGVVRGFHEKVTNPPSNLANAAIYLLEPSVLTWLRQNPEVSDFSTQVVPHFLGKIATWNNTGKMRDIGSPEALFAAQSDPVEPFVIENDAWQRKFEKSEIYRKVASLSL